MATYRFFRIGCTGRVVSREEHECRSDAHALTRARSVSHGHDIEIWCGSVRVAVRKRDRFVAYARNFSSGDLPSVH